jgi:hypothetical protein
MSSIDYDFDTAQDTAVTIQKEIRREFIKFSAWK